MNLFNRVVIVTLLVVLLAATFLSMLAPRAVVDILRNALDQIKVTIPFYNILSGAYWAYRAVSSPRSSAGARRWTSLWMCRCTPPWICRLRPTKSPR
jgi:hypothetical protein